MPSQPIETCGRAAVHPSPWLLGPEKWIISGSVWKETPNLRVELVGTFSTFLSAREKPLPLVFWLLAKFPGSAQTPFCHFWSSEACGGVGKFARVLFCFLAFLGCVSPHFSCCGRRLMYGVYGGALAVLELVLRCGLSAVHPSPRRRIWMIRGMSKD